MNSEIYDVIIFSGQSNMQGQSECILSPAPVEGCLEYRYLTDTLVPLKHPTGEYVKTDATAGAPFVGDTILEEDKFLIWHKSIAIGAASLGNSSLLPSFCQSYRSICGRNVLAVHAAKGATRIDQWLGDSKSYKVLLEKTKGALKTQSEIGKLYFVWLQGESDAGGAMSEAEYKQKLTELKENLKRDLNIDKFGIIRVGHWTNDDRDLEIMNAQDAVCEEDSDFVMLSRLTAELSQKPEFINPHARGHYSARALEMIGEEAGAALAKI